MKLEGENFPKFVIKGKYSDDKSNSKIIAVLRQEAWNLQKALATLNFLWIIAQRKEIWVGFTIQQLIPSSTSSQTMTKLVKNPNLFQETIVANDNWYSLVPSVEKEIRKQNGGIPVDGILVNLFAYNFKFVCPWLIPKQGNFCPKKNCSYFFS